MIHPTKPLAALALSRGPRKSARYPSIDLDGALVAVTGAARGIGLATARRFAQLGARVALGDLDTDLARTAAAGLGTAASGHRLDVSDEDSFARFLIDAEDHHGRPVDVLVNNAGVMPNGAFLAMDDRIDRLIMGVNVHGPIHGMRLVAPGMVERGRGHIVNVASLVGKHPLEGLAVYSASKAAAVGLSAAVRMELEDTGVSVSTVLPSAVNTELSSGIDTGMLPKVEPEDIAEAVVHSVRTRSAEIAVPGYLGPLTTLSPLAPESVTRTFRRLLKSDAALTRVDDTVRNRYLGRILGTGAHPA